MSLAGRVAYCQALVDDTLQQLSLCCVAGSTRDADVLSVIQVDAEEQISKTLASKNDFDGEEKYGSLPDVMSAVYWIVQGRPDAETSMIEHVRFEVSLVALCSFDSCHYLLRHCDNLASSQLEWSSVHSSVSSVPDWVFSA